MAKAKTQRHRRRISATDLAALGRCERQAMYRFHGYAERVAPRLAAARRRGEVEHAERHRLVTAPRPVGLSRGPCFIASALYGADAWQTEMLRDWRDRLLIPHWWGRVLVRIYYRLSPSVAIALTAKPRLQRLVRAVLNRLIRQLGRR